MSPDTKLIKKQKRSEDRRNKQKKREKNEELRRQEDNAVMDPSVEEEIEENEAENPLQDPEYKPSTYQQAKMNKKPDKALLELPTKSLAEGVAVLAARCRQSVNEVLTLFAKIIKMGGGDLHDYILSRST